MAATTSATHVHPDLICRSTTGTGTSARLALMHHGGRLQKGDSLETMSLRKTGFIGKITGARCEGDPRAVDNSITGRDFILARPDIVINPDDPMVRMSGLKHILDAG